MELRSSQPNRNTIKAYTQEAGLTTTNRNPEEITRNKFSTRMQTDSTMRHYTVVNAKNGSYQSETLFDRNCRNLSPKLTTRLKTSSILTKPEILPFVFSVADDGR